MEQNEISIRLTTLFITCLNLTLEPSLHSGNCCNTDDVGNTDPAMDKPVAPTETPTAPGSWMGDQHLKHEAQDLQAPLVL